MVTTLLQLLSLLHHLHCNMGPCSLTRSSSYTYPSPAATCANMRQLVMTAQPPHHTTAQQGPTLICRATLRCTLRGRPVRLRGWMRPASVRKLSSMSRWVKLTWWATYLAGSRDTGFSEAQCGVLGCVSSCKANNWSNWAGEGWAATASIYNIHAPAGVMVPAGPAFQPAHACMLGLQPPQLIAPHAKVSGSPGTYALAHGLPARQLRHQVQQMREGWLCLGGPCLSCVGLARQEHAVGVHSPCVVVGHREHGLRGAAQLRKAGVGGGRCVGRLRDGQPAWGCIVHDTWSARRAEDLQEPCFSRVLHCVQAARSGALKDALRHQ